MLYPVINKALSRAAGTPPYIILFVSDKCRMRCKHCWYNEQWKKKNINNAHLSFKELQSLAGSIKRIAFLSLTGGEAFLREDIVEITEMFSKTTKLQRYQVPTSGFDTELIISSAEQMLKINRNIPFRVDVSIDGTENTHDFIRNVEGSFRQAVKTVVKLNELKKRYPYFDVGVITTVSAYNQDELAEISGIVQKTNKSGEWMVNITRGKPRDPFSADVDTEKYFEAHKIINSRINEGNYSGHGGHFLSSWLTAKNAARRKKIRSILKGECIGGGCAAGTLGGVIYIDGNVTPCEMVDQSFGNLRDFDYSLQLLWNSGKADKIRSWIQETKCLCTQECFLSLSMLIQPKCWPDIIFERIRLLL
jgi:MoaA/NifB/PqqE/SkfB family radical SAM enzyme